MTLRYEHIIVILLVVVGAADASAQVTQNAHEAGLPFYIRSFQADEYRMDSRNWAVVQDPRGVVFVANNTGILEYDGEQWRTIDTPGGIVVRSLDVGADGVVYAGMSGDFGYLAPDSSNELGYVSLVPHLPEAEREFEDIWGVHVTSGGVYFQSHEAIYRWDGERFQIWKSPVGYHTSFVVDDAFYAREGGRGLVHVVGDSLRVVPGGDYFESLAVFTLLPYEGGRMLVGTRKGFFLHDGSGIEPFQTEIDPFLENGRLYHGCRLADGTYAFSLIGNGVYIVDASGRLLQVLDETAELPEGEVNHLYPDAEGGLWLALHNKGVMRVDVRSPLSRYDDRLGLKGLVNSMRRHRDTLYVGTGAGLFYLDQHPLRARKQLERSSFVTVPGVPEVWSMLSVGEELLVSTDRAIYVVQGRKARRIYGEKAFKLYKPAGVSEYVYAGTKDGLAILERGPEGWVVEETNLVDEEVQYLTEDDQGRLWLSTSSGNVMHLSVRESADGLPIYELKTFESDNLLSNEGTVLLSQVDGRVAFVTKEGFFRYRDPATSTAGSRDAVFYRDTSFVFTDDPKGLGSAGDLLSYNTSKDGKIWLVYADRIDIAVPQGDGSYARTRPAKLQFARDSKTLIYPDDGGVTWVSNGDELVRYNANLDRSNNYEPQTLLRRIVSVSDDRLLYGGGLPLGAGTDTALVRVPFTQNAFRLDYAAPVYNRETALEYQYRLAGTAEGWSDWSRSTQHTFANLAEGAYRFEVRARKGASFVTAPTSVAFEILPPWYRTAWAYGAYFGLGLLVVLAFRRYRRAMAESRRARVQERQLARERLARERLQEANERLEQANQLKDNFLANTSHELRTPLTAILGFTAVLKEEAEAEAREFLEIIEGNGERLLDTLNALLDIAKLRAGIDDIEQAPVDMGTEAREVARLLQPLAQRKGIALRYEAPARPVWASLNLDFYERILHNLIGNAIKFTEKGHVTVTVRRTADEAVLQVRDTGIGISPDFLPHLFEEFKQESTGISRLHEGSGLGMAITARLIEHMEGVIDVESEKGRGTLFVVRFPVLPVTAPADGAATLRGKQ